jgi:hypothetical protein
MLRSIGTSITADQPANNRRDRVGIASTLNGGGDRGLQIIWELTPDTQCRIHGVQNIASRARFWPLCVEIPVSKAAFVERIRGDRACIGDNFCPFDSKRWEVSARGRLQPSRPTQRGRGKGISWSEAGPSPRKTRERPLGRPRAFAPQISAPCPLPISAEWF